MIIWEWESSLLGESFKGVCVWKTACLRVRDTHKEETTVWIWKRFTCYGVQAESGVALCNSQIRLADSVHFPYAQCPVWLDTVVCMEKGPAGEPIMFPGIHMGLSCGPYSTLWGHTVKVWSPINTHITVLIQISHHVHENWGELRTHIWLLHNVGNPDMCGLWVDLTRSHGAVWGNAC